MLTRNLRRTPAPPLRTLNLRRWWTPAPPTTTADISRWRDASRGDVYAWGYALRREWPDGTHDLFGFTPKADTAQLHLDRDRSYWRHGPVRPTAVYLVAAHATDVSRHPVTGCRHSTCPNTPDQGQPR